MPITVWDVVKNEGNANTIVLSLSRCCVFQQYKSSLSDNRSAFWPYLMLYSSCRSDNEWRARQKCFVFVFHSYGRYDSMLCRCYHLCFIWISFLLLLSPIWMKWSKSRAMRKISCTNIHESMHLSSALACFIGILRKSIVTVLMHCYL